MLNTNTYNNIRIVVIVSKFAIIVDILIVRESLMILRLLDLTNILPGHVTSECSLDFDNHLDGFGASKPIVRILIERGILDVIVVDLTIAAAT